MLEKRTVVLVVLFVVGALSVGCGPRSVPAEATPLGLPEDVADTAKQRLSLVIDVPVEEIDVVRVNRVDWRDTCLELGGTDEFCGQALTPRWLIILEAEGQEYELHTDIGADTVRIKK